MISIRLFGNYDISHDGRPVTGFVSSKGPALVAYLAVTGRAHAREHLAGLLWSDVPDTDARASLRVVLSNLRQTLGPDLFTVSRSSIGIREDAAFESDAGQFVQALADTGNNAPVDDGVLTRAVDLYTGDFLDGFSVRDAPLFEEWVATQREHFRGEAVKALEQLARLRVEEGDHLTGAATLERLLAIDPWHEEAFRQYLIELALAGRRSAALVQYESFVEMLDRELEVAPEPETINVAERVRSGDIGISTPVGTTETETSPVTKPETRRAIAATSFVGREVELAQIAEHLANPAIRLISIIGPGGSGKTRLATQVLVEHAHSFDSGAHVAYLAGITQVDQIIPTVAEVLDIDLPPRSDPLDVFAQQIGEHRLLLLLDNFEHLLSGTGAVNELLERLPGLRLLVTSRERLALRAEWIVPLAGLPMPIDADQAETRHSEAVQLFIERARQVRPDFLPEADDLRAIASICRYVDGLPLGIELAASWLRMMDCAEVAVRMRENLDFLTSTLQDVPDRHRSIRAAFDGSWKLLDERNRRILASLSVFSSGFSVDAARTVADATLPDLVNLVDKSLIRREASGRFGMHELLQQYAAERLTAADADEQSVFQRHASYFAGVMTDAGRRLKGAAQAETLRAMDADLANLRAAWDRMLAHRDYEQLDGALDGMGMFFDLQRQPAQGFEWMRSAEQTLRSESEIGAQGEILLGRVIGWQARFNLLLGHVDTVDQQLSDAESLLGRHGCVDQLIYRFDTRGRIASTRGEFPEARTYHQQALQAARQTGDQYGESLALNRLSGFEFDIGNIPAARDGFARSLAARRAIQDWDGVARDLGNLGEVYLAAGDYEKAGSYFDDCIALFRELGIGPVPSRLECRGHLALLTGRLDDAQEFLNESRQVATVRGDQYVAALAALRLAELALLRGQPEAAADLLDECRVGFDELGLRKGIAEWGIVDSKRALADDEAAEALRYAAHALEVTGETETVLYAALARGASCRALLRMGRVDEAALQVGTAIDSVRNSGAIPVLLDLVVASCLVRIAIEQKIEDCDNFTGIVSVLLFVQRHRAAWYATKQEAEMTLAILTSRVSPASLQPALDVTRSLSLDVVLDQLEPASTYAHGKRASTPVEDPTQPGGI